MREQKFLGMVAIALAVVVSAVSLARAWERVKTREVHTIDVTGSAKRRITSDLIVWTAELGAQATDRQSAYKQLHDHAGKTLAYLAAQGVAKEEIRPSSVSVQEVIDTEYVGTGE